LCKASYRNLSAAITVGKSLQLCKGGAYIAQRAWNGIGRQGMSNTIPGTDTW
jgi:hypothetical protein